MIRYALACVWAFAAGTWIGVGINVGTRSTGSNWVYVDVHSTAVGIPTGTPELSPSPTPEGEPVAVAAGTGGVVQALAPIEQNSNSNEQAQRVREVWQSGSPLYPYAEGLIAYAKRKGIDYRIVVAMSILESSAGRQACGGNAWGLGACKGSYGQIQTFDEGYRMVIDNLASPLYAGLSQRQVFCQWVSGNRGCVDAHSQEYAAKGMSIVEKLQ